MNALAVLLAAGGFLQAQDAPRPERDLHLSLVLKTPARTHPWWPLFVEVWAENHSTNPVPIVRAMNGSWEDWVEPALAWRGSVTGPDGKATAIRSGHLGRCGNYQSNWVSGILVVPPGGRQRILIADLSRLLRTGRNQWLMGSLEVRLAYEYKGRPSRPSHREEEPRDKERRFGAFADVAPFRMESDAVTVELVPPSVSSQELERELALEVELENEGRFLAWEEPRGRARIRNLSSRSHRIASPRGCMRLVRPGAFSSVAWSPDQTLELAGGETLELPLVQPLLGTEWQERSESTLELAYVWPAVPVGLTYDEPDVSARYGPMGDVPPFQLRSRPCSIVFESPLTIELVPLAPVPTKRRYRLKEVLALVLRNTGDVPLELASPEEPLHVTLASPDGIPHVFDVKVPLLLAPHGELDLTADPELGIDAWNYDARNGAVPSERGSASVLRKGWYRPVQSREVEFELR